MTEDLHDLTKFLLDRLKTYPEEFYFADTGLTSKKWRTALRAITLSGTAEDKAAFDLASMDYALQASLKTLLAPEDSADDLVGQSSNSSGVQNIPGGQFGGNGGPGLTRQQAQAAIAHQQSLNQQLARQTVKNLVSQAKDQQKSTVTIPTSLAKAAGLKPMTAKEQIEHWKKRLGL